MLKKLLTTRIFANFFNEKVGKVADFFGVWGLVAAYVFFPIALRLAAHITGLIPPSVFEGYGDDEAPPIFLFFLGVIFVFGCAMFLIRIFAARYRYGIFFALMWLPIFALFCIFLPAAILMLMFLYESFCHAGVFIPFLVAEIAIFFIVFFGNFTHYRVFQLVGSLIPICFALHIYFKIHLEYLVMGKIFLAAVVLFWILSRAHILFRDKLLDYLESKGALKNP